MAKFCTSYFYQVRFFEPNIIPMSTAVSDPKWYHENKGKDNWFIDKNGVVNGFRIEPFVPGKATEGLCQGKEICGREGSARDCPFLKAYFNQLMALDFEDIMQRFASFEERYKKDFGVEGEITFALLVHEAPDNPCSERAAIQKWFTMRDIECKEFNKDECL